MHKTLTALAVGLLVPIAAAQCPLDPALGTLQPYVAFDYVYPIQPIGFAFPFGGATYSNVHITTKGMLYLSNAGVPAPGSADYTATSAELVGGPPRICPFWTDMGVDATGGVYLNSTATECTITWKNAMGYGNTLPTFDV